MVGHFGKQVSGFAFTVSGWVQPYGSRYVKATCFSRFCFVDIDDMMGSDLRYNYEKPSELEVVCFEARKLIADRRYKADTLRRRIHELDAKCVIASMDHTK